MCPSAVAETGPRIRRPQPKQVQFLTATEDEVMYGGAAYGGKTEAALMFAVRRREKYPGTAGLMLRRTFSDLSKEGALIPRSKELLWGRAHWNEQRKKWTFPNGSVLQFGYLQDPSDHLQYQGTIYEDITWEELTQFPSEERYEYVNNFCRSRYPECKPLKRATTNPGGPGHGWVRARFIDIGPWNQTYAYTLDVGGSPVTLTRRFIPAKADDNPAGLEKDPTYLARLASLPEDLRRAFRDGDWDVIAGNMFTEFRRHLHVVEPFPIPRDWVRWRGLDYGFAAPFCCHWFAREPGGKRLAVYRELHQAGLVAKDQARAIRLASQDETVRLTAADPSMWAHTGHAIGKTLAEEYASAGVELRKAINDRKAGWSAVHEALAWKEIDGRLVQPPRVQIFSTCQQLIKSLANAPRDQIDPEDVHREFDADHPLDSFRYGLMVERRTRARLPDVSGGVRRW